MAAAARVRVADYFEADEWARLTARSYWIGPALVAHCWAVIFAAMAAAAAWPILIPFAIMVIGARQLGLAILMHDAAHGALHPIPVINDFLGDKVCAAGLARYRSYHLQHHKFAQQEEDPDLILSAPFPITRDSLGRKVVRDLTGQTFIKQRFGLTAAKIKNRSADTGVTDVLVAEAHRMRRFLVGNLLGFAVLAALGYWWVWIVLWLVPMACWLPLVTRLRNIAEHALIAKNEPDPLRHARTTKAGWIERAIIAPYWVNFHCEHHMFMYVPCYRLSELSRALAAKGVDPLMETAPGYVEVLRRATALRTFTK